MPINIYRERDGVNKKKINIFFKLLKLLNMKTVAILIINYIFQCCGFELKLKSNPESNITF